MEVSDVLYRIPGHGQRLSGLTRDQVYKLLKQGKLKAVQVGGRAFVTKDSLTELPQKLPPYEPGKKIVGRRKEVVA